MKKILLWAAVLCAGLAAMPVQAQNDGADAVIERYERATGLDRLSPSEMTCVMMEVVAEVQGMAMPMTMVLKEPGKMNVDMEGAGQKMRMVTDGEKGWVSIPGQGTMPMPDEMMAQLREQTNVSQNYRWNKKDYSYKLAGEVQEGGRTYTGVLMTPKKPQPQVGNMVVYFDKENGLVSFLTIDIEQGGQTQSARMNFSAYRSYGKVKLPSLYKMLVNGSPMMTMEIKALQYAYPAADSLFAKPE